MVNARRNLCRSASVSLLRWMMLIGCVSGCGEQTSQPAPASSATKLPTDNTTDSVVSGTKDPETDTAILTQEEIAIESPPAELVQRTLSQRHQLSLDNVDLKSALKLIGDYHRLNFDLSSLSDEQLGRPLSVDVAGEPLMETLQRMLATHGLKYDILPDGVVSVSSL